MAEPTSTTGAASNDTTSQAPTMEDYQKWVEEGRPQPPTDPPTFAANLAPSDPDDPLNAVDDRPVKFESAEHSAIADTLTLYKIDRTPFRAIDQPLIANWTVTKLFGAFSKKIDLYFGRTIALAGDYFTNPGKDTSYKSPHSWPFHPENPSYLPVCGAGGTDGTSLADCKDRFGGLIWAIEKDYNNNLYDLMPLMDTEVDVIKAVVEKDSGMEATAYHLGDQYGLPSTGKFEKATLNSYNARTGLYAWLLLINFDHFGQDAVTCYTAGHLFALERARAAAKINDSVEQQKALNGAYLAEAAACHYLTDLFSSGHARTPRRAFHVCKTLFPDVATLEKMAEALVKKSVVWDEMTHIIHDDDSATGVVVQNKLGEFWTAFGDKQYFMPANTHNRMRCIQCVQTSVDELFDVGFKGDPNNALDATTFKALKLIPLPTQCVNDDIFASISAYNTMPLWLVSKNDIDPGQNFWYRKDPNDHSDYALSTATKPDFGSTIGAAINSYAFVGADQFPPVLSFNVGISGVLQLMQISDAKSSADSLTANIYGTIAPPPKMLANFNSSLTVRNQARAFHSNSHTNDGIIVHTCSYVTKSGNGSSFVFIFSAKRGTGTTSNSWNVAVSCYQVRDDVPANEIAEFDPTLDPGKKQSQPQMVAMFKNTPLLTTPDPGQASTAEKEVGSLRFFIGPYFPGTSDSTPAIVAVKYSTASSNCTVWAATLNSALNAITIKPVQTVNVGQNILMVKPLANGEGLLADALVTGNSPSWNSYALKFDSSGTITQKEFKSTIAPASNDPRTTTWLARPFTGSGDNAIVNNFHAAHPDFNLAIRHESSNFSSAAHTCSSADRSLMLLQPYFDALAPSSGDTKIISAALMKSSSAKVGTCVYIRTHVKSADPSTSFQCYDSVIPDPFATKDRISSGYYFNIGWLMVADPESTLPGSPGLLQVFSFYGCLGLRLFGVRDAAQVVFSLVGQQCYNGQTSKEMGSSVSKLFGAGILNWRTPGFDDTSVFTPQIRGTTMSAGSWDAFGGQQATKLGIVLDDVLSSGGKSWRWGTNTWWQ